MAADRLTQSHPATGPQPVYLIDDDQAMRESTQFLLDSVGIRSTVFADPIEFLHALPRLEPGCVLTDVRMPTMSGFELRSALAKRGVDWPVILMSGHSDAFQSAEMPPSGVLDFIQKPFTLDRLAEALDRAFLTLCADFELSAPSRSIA